MAKINFPIFFWFEVFSFLISLLCFRQLKKSFLIYFVPFLFLIALAEFFGAYLPLVLHKSNIPIYNTLNFIIVPFYLFFFRYYIMSKRIQRIIILFVTMFFAFSFFNIVWLQKPYQFNHWTFLFGSLLLILSSCLYFLNLILYKPNLNLFKYESFWITVGVFFFYTGTLIYFLLFNYLQENGFDSKGKIFDLLILYLNIALYSSISAGLICRRVLTK